MSPEASAEGPYLLCCADALHAERVSPGSCLEKAIASLCGVVEDSLAGPYSTPQHGRAGTPALCDYSYKGDTLLIKLSWGVTLGLKTSYMCSAECGVRSSYKG